MFNKRKLKELETEIKSLKAENIELKNKYTEIVFINENPNIFKVGEKVKEGIVLEKRIVDNSLVSNSIPKVMVNPLFTPLLLTTFVSAYIKREPYNKNNLSLIRDIINKKYWEYRIFNIKSKTEKWIRESSLNKA